MKLKKRIINNGNYDITYYPCNRFSSMDIMLIFQFERTKQTYNDVKMLLDYMITSSKKYNTRAKYLRRIRELYNMDIEYRMYTRGENIYVIFKVWLANPRLIKDDYFKDAIEFAKETLYNPNFKDKKVNKYIFNKDLRQKKETLKDLLKNPAYLAHYNFWKTAANNSLHMDNLFGSSSELNRILKNIDKRMYDIYEKFMDSFVSMQLFGDFTKDEINIIKDTFKFNKVNKLNDKVDLKYTYKKCYKVKKDSTIKESKYFELYQIKDYNWDKRHYYKLLVDFLNMSTGRLIHLKLREELGIVYHAEASFRATYGAIVFRCDINSSNKDKCQKGISEILDTLRDEKVVKELLDKAVKQAEEIVYLSEEDYENYIDYIRIEALKFYDQYHEYLEKIKKVTPDDFIKALNNLERRTTFLYEGTK